MSFNAFKCRPIFVTD
uniref:Uncharacterized protein n=1 Tax=Anguilla anguilla TaxID=7936 RepID=A0A0E9RUU8_ANGAN